MTTQEILASSQITQIRALQARIEELTHARDHAQAELEALKAHFDLALLAMRDADHLSDDGTMIIIDGWNAILGAAGVDGRQHGFHSSEELLACAQNYAAHKPGKCFIWIVYDGDKANAYAEKCVRISWTGGSGAHRADRLITDYVKMHARAGIRQSLIIVTADRDFARAIASPKVSILSPCDFRKLCG